MARTILIEGPSGRGKSTSFRNMDPATTLMVNVERKTLPWKGGAKFPQTRPDTVKQVFDALDKYCVNKTIKALVIDSFSAFSDMLVNEARVLKTGWDVWSYYNQMMYLFFDKLRKFNSNGIHVILVGHPESLEDPEGGTGIMRLKTKGKEWEGTTEKEFDIVLWADIKIESEDKILYNFVTQTNGKHPAKSPMSMLPLRMTNDMVEVIKLIDDYDK